MTAARYLESQEEKICSYFHRINCLRVKILPKVNDIIGEMNLKGKNFSIDNENENSKAYLISDLET